MMRRTLLAVLAGALGMAPAAYAAGGTWGAGHYAYLDGVVCSSGGLTSPLASWDFGDAVPEFLATAVVSNGAQDSAVLPEASIPGRFTQPLSPGEAGFTSAADIATYAQLISRYGTSRAATVARAVLDHTDPGHAPSCVAAGSAASLVSAAARAAGPYTITLSAARTPAEAGQRDTLSVRITGGAGQPAVGVRVTLAADAAVFGAGTARTATTGRDGTASVPFTVPNGLTSGTVDIQATASAAVGLELVSVVSGTAQSYATALYADPPQTYTGQISVPVDQTAHPVLAIAPSSTGGVVEAPLELTLAVSGMHGHAGEAQLEVTGPAPLDPAKLCSADAPSVAAADNAATYTSPPITVVGDESVDAGSWIPGKPGCYRVQATLSTTDAVPQARATAHAAVLTVLDTTSAFQASRTVIGPGPVSGTLTEAHTHGLAGTAQVQLRGPVAPGDGDCSGADWPHAAEHTIAQFAVHGDRTYPVTSAPVSAPGCYRLGGSVALTLPGGGLAEVPLQVGGDSAVYVLRPSVAVVADQTWAVSPAAVGTHVTVTGTFGQAGTVQVAMLRAPAGPLGCRSVDLAHAHRLGIGPAVRFVGDSTVAVPSGSTPQSGCYALVPTVTMAVDRAITATGVVGAAGSVILAGLSPEIVANGDAPLAKPLETPHGLTVWSAALIYLALFGVVGAVIVKVAANARHEEHRPAAGLDLLD